MFSIIRPFIFKIDPEMAHDLAIQSLKYNFLPSSVFKVENEELLETKNKLDLLNYDFLHKRNMLFGTPDYIVEKIKELQSELNLKNLLVWSNFPGVKHEDAMKSIKLFNEEVIPKINSSKIKLQ